MWRGDCRHTRGCVRVAPEGDFTLSDERGNPSWARTADGKVMLRLIEEWETGLTEHGDVALSLTSTLGNDPQVQSGETYRSQFICTRDDAKAIAHMILRTLAFSEAKQA